MHATEPVVMPAQIQDITLSLYAPHQQQAVEKSIAGVITTATNNHVQQSAFPIVYFFKYFVI